LSLAPNGEVPEEVPADLVYPDPDPETTPLEDFVREQVATPNEIAASHDLVIDAGSREFWEQPDEEDEAEVKPLLHATLHEAETVFAKSDVIVDVSEAFKSRYGVHYTYGERDTVAYYETEQTNENLALLAFHGDVEQSEKVFPGLVTNVKVKSITRYFD
jgi:hypothetical protein